MELRKASVKSMGQGISQGIGQVMWQGVHQRVQLLQCVPTGRKFFLAAAAIVSLSFTMPMPIVAVVMQQSVPAPPQDATSQANAAPPGPVLSESLRPALTQVGSALSQVRIDHWKLPRESKQQLSGDANSIQQDLTAQLPGLFQTAQQSPTALEPQLNVMHNVDALYDVLVRITTAANLAGGKADAAVLDNALLHLESARKTAASQLLQAAAFQDQQIMKFQAQLRAAHSVETPANEPTKTIVVNNRITHRTRHSKTAQHRKTLPSTPSTNNEAGSSNSHPAAP